MKRLVSAFLAGAMALSLAACGGAASTSTAASASASASGSAAASQAAGSDLDYIKGKGKLVIGYTVYEPMNYTDADGNFTGFDTELATAVCEKLGVEPEFVEINWDTKVVELDAKSIDCIWNGMTLTDDIMQNTATTKAYAKNAQVVVVKDGTDYTSTADLVGKTVVAEAGSAGEAAIEGDENLAQADYVSKSVQTDCLMEVAAGTADAAVLDLTLANAMIGEGTDYADLKIVDELNAYNDAMRAQGEDDKVIVFSDTVGTLMSAVTKIVDMVSNVLVAFVAISLVVSSIMIGVITYISVLERRKEIGILRAIGASKRNVSEVFNAETFIIGLCSGIMGIVLSEILLIPGNIIIQKVSGTSTLVASLPVDAALFLVALATLLTILAGIIPARGAAKCNPVKALRAE